MSYTTSPSLLAALKSPEANAAWIRFDRIYQPLLRNWLSRASVAPDVIDDVCQDTLAKVHQEICHFQHSGNPGAFRAWLRAIVANRLRTVQRRQSREAETITMELADQLATDDSQLAQLWNREHDTHLIARLLEMIAPDFQELTMQAFRRVVLEQIPQAQVAEELGMSVNAVRIAQSRVLTALRTVGEGLLD